MASPKKKSKRTKDRVKIAEILQRVDRLPVLDSRNVDEILGYDRNGLPRTEDRKRVAESAVPEPDRVPDAMEAFLKYRHRDWER